jgi:hypothetical protein
MRYAPTIAPDEENRIALTPPVLPFDSELET